MVKITSCKCRNTHLPFYVQPFNETKNRHVRELLYCGGGRLRQGPDALLRAAAEKLDHRRPVAEAGLGGRFPAEVM